jgi:hypothetical protein
MLMAPSRAGGYPKGGLMPASTPEQIHRLFEEAFNAGDLDGLMELYEPDAALIAQPGSLANGIEQARAALQDFLAGIHRLRFSPAGISGFEARIEPGWAQRGRQRA